MIVMKRIVPLLLLILSLQKVHGYLDQQGVPKEGIGGYRGFGKNLWCLITFDWSREKSMLAAFDNILLTNKPEDIKTFKDKFYPEDCGRHPRLVQQAIENNRSDLIKFMQEKGLNIKGTFQEHCADKAEQKTDLLKHPLHTIIQKHGDSGISLISLLIASGFDPKQKDDQGNTLLHKAAKNRSVQMIKLLKASVNVNERNKEGKTSFLVALESGNQVIIDDLIAQGASSCLKDAKGNTPVHEMAIYASPAALKALEELAKTQDFDVNIIDAHGNTPIIVATKNNNIEGVKLLLRKRAITKLQNSEGDSPLLIAATIQPPSAVDKLFNELLKAEDVDRDVTDAVEAVIYTQEDFYCNPPRDAELLSPNEIDNRLYECSVIKSRKESIRERLENGYISEYKRKLNAINEEHEKAMQDEADLKQKMREEKDKAIQEKLGEVKALDAESQSLGQEVVVINQQKEEFQRVKNEPLDKITEIYKKQKKHDND